MSIDPIKSCAPNPAQDIIETVSLRRATLADAPALALIGAATFLEAFTWMLPGADILAHGQKNHTAEAYTHYLADPKTRITVAVTGPAVGFPDEPGSIVGYVLVCTPELPTFDVVPTDIELKRIYLFSRFRSAPVLDAAARSHPEPSSRAGPDGRRRVGCTRAWRQPTPARHPRDQPPRDRVLPPQRLHRGWNAGLPGRKPAVLRPDFRQAAVTG